MVKSEYHSVQVADVGVQSVSITQSRHKVVAFTVPLDVEPLAILIPAPTESSRLFACTKPFQLSVIIHHFMNLDRITRNRLLVGASVAVTERNSSPFNRFDNRLFDSANTTEFALCFKGVDWFAGGALHSSSHRVDFD